MVFTRKFQCLIFFVIGWITCNMYSRYTQHIFENWNKTRCANQKFCFLNYIVTIKMEISNELCESSHGLDWFCRPWMIKNNYTIQHRHYFVLFRRRKKTMSEIEKLLGHFEVKFRQMTTFFTWKLLKIRLFWVTCVNWITFKTRSKFG